MALSVFVAEDVLEVVRDEEDVAVFEEDEEPVLVAVEDEELDLVAVLESPARTISMDWVNTPITPVGVFKKLL